MEPKEPGVPINEIAQWLKDHPHKGFKPLPCFNRIGSQIDWQWKDDPAYAEAVHVDGVWVGSLLRSMETKEVVGVKIFMPESWPLSIPDPKSEERR